MFIIPAHPTTAPRPAGRRAAGFTFIEVMFAVLILGFGVIMIAAMLPVAVRETSRTRETAAGNGTVESGFHVVEATWEASSEADQYPLFPYAGKLPPTDVSASPILPRVVTFPAYEWATNFPVNAASTPNQPTTIALFLESLGSRVASSDPSSAWIPFYTRGGSGPPQLAVVGVRVRNVEAMRQPPASLTGTVPDYLLPGAFYASADNAPLPIEFTLVDNAQADYDRYASYAANLLNNNGTVEKLEPDVVELSEPDGATTPDLATRIGQATTERAALVLVNRVGRIRVLTLGKPLIKDGDDVPDGFGWTLDEGGDVRVTAESPTGPLIAEFEPGVVYSGYLVGRMLKDPNKPWAETDNPYVGPSQVSQSIDGQPLPR